MSRIMMTSPPEVNPDGQKRWYLGDINDLNERVFLFESTHKQRAENGCKRFMVRTFKTNGEPIREIFFDRSLTLNRHLRRLFHVDEINLGEDLPFQMAA